MRCWNLSTLPIFVASDVTSNKQRVCACGLYQISAGDPSMVITRRRLHSSNYAVSEQVVTPREPRGEPLNSAPADRRIRSQCLVSSLVSDVAFSETVRCWCYSKLMLVWVWVVRFINDVAVAESDMEIFLQSRRNIRNCALFGNFSFYFSFSAEKDFLLIFRLFFGRKFIFTFGGFTFLAENGKIIFGRPLISCLYYPVCAICFF